MSDVYHRIEVRRRTTKSDTDAAQRFYASLKGTAPHDSHLAKAWMRVSKSGTYSIHIASYRGTVLESAQNGRPVKWIWNLLGVAATEWDAPAEIAS